ncbi:MAG: heavy metal translocating P-type ATPase [Bdellovibrionales bacterium]
MQEVSRVSTVFRVAGMDCGNEIAAIRKALAHPEIIGVETNLMSSTVRIVHSAKLSEKFLREKVESAGVKVAAQDVVAPLVARKSLSLVVISGLFLSLGLILEFALGWAEYSAFIYGAAVLSGGALIFPKVPRALREFRLDMNVLMSVAVVGAFAIREYSEAATVVFLFSVSELLEAFSVARARRAIREVLDLTPKMAQRIGANDRIEEIRIEDVRVGDILLVKSGERIPADGVVESGASHVNQAPLTGESVPVEKKPGDSVLAGTINESGILRIKASKGAAESKAAQIVKLIEDAQSKKAPSERFVDSFARIYTPIMFLVALLTLFVPPLAFGAAWDIWVYRALVILVVACPCALVISTPVSIVSGLTAMAKRGVLVKGGIFLEALGRVRAIALDKTGTITEGRPRVIEIINLGSETRTNLVRIVGSIEKLSSHPLAKAVVEFAEERGVLLEPASDFKTIAGRGAQAKVGDHEYFVGNHRMAHDIGVCTPQLEDLLSSIEENAQSVIVVGHRPHANCTGEVLGVLTLGDAIRPNARAAIQALHRSGVEHVVMLSGDNQKTASAISKQVGVEKAYGDLLPEDKVTRIQELVQNYRNVAMIGDGINDAPALAQASVGISMGMAGTDTAMETADVALMRDDLEQVAVAIGQGRRALSVIKFNIGFAIAIKAVFLVLAVSGHTNLWFAVAADTGASILVILNALRLLRV